jgi:predicted nucleic acid-binding protein
MKIFLVTFVLLFAGMVANAQPEVLNQQLNKALDVIEAQDKQIEAQKSEIAALKRSESLAIELADARKAQNLTKDEELEKKDAQITALRAIKCDESRISLLFGAIKFTKKTCR